MKSIGSRICVAAVAIGLISSAGCAVGQTPANQKPGLSMKQLDNLANENSAILHRNFGPPPPQSSIPHTQYTPVPGFWKCMSVDNYKHIYSRPATSSPPIGETFSRLAAGSNIGGFTKIYFARGKIGFVKSKYIHPFYDKYAPASICQFKGVQPNGIVLFDVGPAS